MILIALDIPTYTCRVQSASKLHLTCPPVSFGICKFHVEFGSRVTPKISPCQFRLEGSLYSPYIESGFEVAHICGQCRVECNRCAYDFSHPESSPAQLELHPSQISCATFPSNLGCSFGFPLKTTNTNVSHILSLTPIPLLRATLSWDKSCRLWLFLEPHSSIQGHTCLEPNFRP